MSDKLRVDVEIFHRDEHSLGAANRDRYGLAIYHWAILIRAKNLDEVGRSVSIDVTNAPLVDENRRNLNPNEEWRYRYQYPVDPLRTGHFLGAMTIGKLPKDVSPRVVDDLLAQIPVPQKGQIPEENCVTWIREAVTCLQRRGYAEQIQWSELSRSGMALGDKTVKEGPPARIKDRFWNLTQRPT